MGRIEAPVPLVLSVLDDPLRRERLRAAVHRADLLGLGRWRVEELEDEQELLREAVRLPPVLVVIGRVPPEMDDLVECFRERCRSVSGRGGTEG